MFSLGTRNSFVVLPFALALPSALEIAAVVIVFKSLVELFGMLTYLWPCHGSPAPTRPRHSSSGVSTDPEADADLRYATTRLSRED